MNYGKTDIEINMMYVYYSLHKCIKFEQISGFTHLNLCCFLLPGSSGSTREYRPAWASRTAGKYTLMFLQNKMYHKP